VEPFSQNGVKTLAACCFKIKLSTQFRLAVRGVAGGGREFPLDLGGIGPTFCTVIRNPHSMISVSRSPLGLAGLLLLLGLAAH
jgi:hypothetical protein